MYMVTGANGNLAGLTIASLRQLIPMSQLAVTTSNPDKAFVSALAAEGVSVRKADFNKPETLVSAFAGIEKLFLIPTQDYDHMRIVQNRNVIDAAQAAGVSHIFYASFVSRNPEPIADRSKNLHYPTEAMIRDSGITYTMLRDAWYAESLVPRLDITLSTGVLPWLAGENRANYIARQDLGLSAAHALTGKGHENKTYSLTMKSSLTGEEAAATVARVFGKDVRHENITEASWVDYVKTYWSDFYGDPEVLAPLIIGQLLAARSGEFDVATDDYKQLTGRDPTTMEGYLIGMRDSGRTRY